METPTSGFNVYENLLRDGRKSLTSGEDTEDEKG